MGRYNGQKGVGLLPLHFSFNKNFLSGRQYYISEGERIVIRTAFITDIPQIVSLLQSIQITTDNLDDKLSKTHKDSFERRGGFFVVWNAAELASFMEDVNNLFLVAVSRDKGKEVIIGFLWCRLDLDNILVSDWKLENKILGNYQTKKFNMAMEKRQVFTAVECAVQPNYHGIGIAYSIIHEMYNWLWGKGYLFAVLQIYIIHGEYQNENFIKRDLPNGASINHIKKYGAICIKKALLPDQIVGHRRFKIGADVFLLDLEYAIKKLKELITNYVVAK